MADPRTALSGQSRGDDTNVLKFPPPQMLCPSCGKPTYIVVWDQCPHCNPEIKC